MKKLIFSLLMLFVVLNLNAQEPQIKIRLADGTERIYKIADVEELSFTKSEKGSLLTIYQTPQEGIKYILTNDVSKIVVTAQEFIIITDYETLNYQLWTIDSLTLKAIEFEKVIIGDKIWMQRNLDVAHYRNGDEIFHAQTVAEWVEAGVQGVGAWCYYDNDPDKGKVYGKLYNWYAVNDPRGLAPAGWRVPSDPYWLLLSNHLSPNEGSKIAGGYDLWEDGDLRNNNDFNSSGFSGLPGSSRDPYGNFLLFGGNNACWWTSTEHGSLAIYRQLFFYSTSPIFKTSENKRSGFSVRCVSNESDLGLSAPLLQTPNNESSEQPIEITFKWDAVSFTDTYLLQVATDSHFTDIIKVEKIIEETLFQVSELEKGVEYFWRVRAVNNDEKSEWSEIWSFETSEFETVIIGEQVWMLRNLEVTHYRNGDPILHVQTNEEWEQTGEQGIGAWCYYRNNADNGKVYGKMYNWHAVNDPRGLVPEGWRVPSDDDWNELSNFLGNYEGSQLAGGYDLWIEDVLSNHSDFNRSGFSGLPGGHRHHSGNFNNVRYLASWWSSSEDSSTDAVRPYLFYLSTNLNKGITNKSEGNYIRCVRDE